MYYPKEKYKEDARHNLSNKLASIFKIKTKVPTRTQLEVLVFICQMLNENRINTCQDELMKRIMT